MKFIRIKIFRRNYPIEVLESQSIRDVRLVIDSALSVERVSVCLSDDFSSVISSGWLWDLELAYRAEHD